jgi:CheY-like chemotaxis protein
MEPVYISRPPAFEPAAVATEPTGQLVELSADLLATVAADGRVELLNASRDRVLGWSEWELFGQPFTMDYLADTSRPLPALVLLDLKLPKVMGLDVLKRVREDPRTHSQPSRCRPRRGPASQRL